MSTFIYLYLLYFLCLFISCNAQSQCKYLHQYVCTFYLNYRWGIGIRKWVSVCILGLLLFRQTLYMSDTICLKNKYVFACFKLSVSYHADQRQVSCWGVVYVLHSSNPHSLLFTPMCCCVRNNVQIFFYFTFNVKNCIYCDDVCCSAKILFL